MIQAAGSRARLTSRVETATKTDSYHDQASISRLYSRDFYTQSMHAVQLSRRLLIEQYRADHQLAARKLGLREKSSNEA
jgi:hypothetical protein